MYGIEAYLRWCFSSPLNYSTCISKCSEIITNDVGASIKAETIRHVVCHRKGSIR